MIRVLRHEVFRRLFAAQVVALLGTGLATVGLALLAFELAGPDAGAVLGTALAIKMIAYVLMAPLAGAFVPLARRKAVLIALDGLRAAVALALPFVTEVWQVYLLIFLLQLASAGFTPLFQSLVPEVLPDERDYTRALSLSRLAYDLENLLSPALAAMLLLVMSFHGLFAGTAMGFTISALLVLRTKIPGGAPLAAFSGPYARMFRGLRIYLRTPRLRGLLAMSLCAAAGGAMVFVNTVVIVRSVLGGGDREVAIALASFGGGSMAVALILPRLLECMPDRAVMTGAGITMLAVLVAIGSLWSLHPAALDWMIVLAGWTLLGMAYAGLVTPGGRLLRRSAEPADFPALFAAQFSLSHACWLLAYPIAGWVGATWGMRAAVWCAAGLVACGVLASLKLWPRYPVEMNS